jgi:PAS domain S-box-containing protein
MFGYTAAEAVGQSITLIVPPERLAEERDMLERLGRGETVDQHDTVRRRKDGREVEISLTVSPIHDEAGAIAGVAVIGRDVTEQRRVQREHEHLLRQADELARIARTLTESLDAAAIAERVVDSVRDALEVASAVLRLREPDGSLRCVALAGKQLEGLEVGYILPPGAGMVARAMEQRRAVWTPDVTADDTTALSDDFRRRLAAVGHRAVLAVPLQARGEVMGALSVAYSVTRSFSDAETAVLQAFADQAALAIRNAQLFARESLAREESEAANRAKDQFLAMLGHELRNPLAAISSAATVLDRLGGGDERAGSARAIIRRQVGRLVRVVDDLLDVARVTTGKIVIEPRSVSLADCVSGCVSALTAAGQLARHRVTVILAPAWVEGDAGRLEQVITNLLVNAVKYTPAGGRIEVRVTREGRHVVLAVEDSGAGISPALRAHVFDLFVQGDRGLDRAQGGLGIGLTLVRRIVELHGGTVDVTSAGAGMGSTFVVRLPAGTAPTPAPVPAASAAASARRVLVIEDNDDAREALRLALALDGHDVLEAEDGLRGIALALDERPHVALIDVGLPGIDGYEVAGRLRARAGEPRPYLVALTGYGQPEDRARALASGFDAFVVKPVEPEALREMLKTLPVAPQPFATPP